jgi:hypothetical protein
MIIMVVIMIVPVPITLGMPALISRTPPSVVALPAAIAFSVQIATALFRFMTCRSMLPDGIIHSEFSFLNPTLAIAVIVGKSLRDTEQHCTAKHCEKNRRRCRPLESLEVQIAPPASMKLKYRSKLGLTLGGGRCLQFI